MGTNKPKTPRPSPAAARIFAQLFRPHNRGVVLSFAILLAFVGGAVYAWQRWGAAALASEDYVVTPQQIHVTPQPAWIHADVKAEALRSAAITQVSLRDRHLVEQLAGAFGLHPWVAKVVRVE